MPWKTPTLKEVRSLNRDNVAAYLPGADASVPNSNLRVLSDQNAAGAHLNLLYLDWLSRQFLPDTAETEWLDRHGQIWLGGRKAATFASGTASVTGTEGVLLPVGTIMSTSDAVQYQTLDDVLIGRAATPVALTALTPGSAGNRESGSQLSLQIAVSGVDAQAAAIDITGGADEESDDDLRARVLLRIRKPPMGGDADDYVQWALAVPGITRAWVSPNEMGIGTVTVRVMADDLRATADGYPASSELSAVRAALDLVRPVAVKDLFVEAPIRQALTVGINNLSVDTSSIRRAIAKAIKAMLFERAAPGQTIYASWMAEAVSGVLGEDHHDLNFANAVMPSAGHMAALGSIFYG